MRPPQHPSAAVPPEIPSGLVPNHVAIVMDGNGRWANQLGLPRTEGHKSGEEALMDVVAGAIELGVREVSVYAFSTENWRRSPAEVRFLMTYSRDQIRRRREVLHSWGVRIQWVGRGPRLWRSVITELEAAQEITKNNDVITLNMCVNYGGRAELVDAAQGLAREVAAGNLKPGQIDEAAIARHLTVPNMPDVDLFWRTSGEQRLSNYLLWQSAYAELVFTDKPWPAVDRRDLWAVIEQYARRDRRYGGAVDAAVTG